MSGQHDNRWSGSDVSWLAVDGDGFVGWFTTNGSGRVPRELTDDVDLFAQEVLLTEWVRAQGRSFRFGCGDEQWLDATFIGLGAYDYSADSDCFERKGEAASMVLAVDLPAPVGIQANRVLRPTHHFKDEVSIPSLSIV